MIVDALKKGVLRRLSDRPRRTRIAAAAVLEILASLLKSNPGATLRAIGGGAVAGAREGLRPARRDGRRRMNGASRADTIEDVDPNLVALAAALTALAKSARRLPRKARQGRR